MTSSGAPVTNDPRYPIGPFDLSAPATPERIAQALTDMTRLPAALAEAVRGLTPEQLEVPHREGGWCARQIAHHIPDSHLNGYARTKLALTEDAPVIKPYDQAKWAELADMRAVPIESSLALVEGLHARWVALGRSLSAEDWQRIYVNPESGRRTALGVHFCLYGWHGRHHVAQITSLRERMGWK
jgi:hypothetical protein